MRKIINVASAAADIAPCRAEGLRKLEYRGYHSACIAVLNGAGVQKGTDVDKPRNLAKSVTVE